MLGRVENTETFVRFLELNLISNLISGSRKIWKCRRGCIALESSRSSCNRHLPSDPKNALFFGYRKDARASLNAHFSWVKKEKKGNKFELFFLPSLSFATQIEFKNTKGNSSLIYFWRKCRRETRHFRSACFCTHYCASSLKLLPPKHSALIGISRSR